MSKIREPDIVFKWTNCCRLCLSQESTIDLFSEASVSQHFPSKIRTCLNFLIYSGDPLPRKICSSCRSKLDNWCQFKKDCIQTDKDLRRRLEPYKGLSFVKEYFDKYRKYEKSSQDGSISLDSMSEYEEEFDDEELCGSELEDEEDDEMRGGYSDFIQREDDYSGLSDSDKVISSSSDYHSYNNKLNYLRNSSKFNDIHHHQRNLSIYRRDSERYSLGRTGAKHEKEKFSNESLTKHCIHNNYEDVTCTNVSVTSEPDIGGVTSEDRALQLGELSTSHIDGNTAERLGVRDAGFRTCPECGVDFPSEEHYAEHSCNAAESGVDSDDNDNFINPLSFVDTSLSEPNKEGAEGEGECSLSGFADKIVDAGADKAESPLTCPACSECFKSVADLKEHYNYPDGTCGKFILLECETCKCKFTTTNELVDHLEMHTKMANGEDMKCDKCEVRFLEETEWKAHLADHDGEEAATEGAFACSKCDQVFCSRELFEKHELIHNQQDLYNAISTPQFTAFEDAEGGEEVADDGEAYEEEYPKRRSVVRCFRCGRLFNSAGELEQHLFLKHKNPTPYFCRKCDLRFSARSQLLMHVRSHMRKSGSSASSAGNNSDNTCTICNAKFFLPSDLQSHLKTHKLSPTEESFPPQPLSQKSWQSYGDNKIDLFARFKCSVCSKIFVHSGSIIRHGKNLHKGQTVYPLRLKRPIFLMKRARSFAPLTPGEKNFKTPQASKQTNSNNAVNEDVSSQQQQQEEGCDVEVNQDGKWEQDSEGTKADASQEFGTEKCPFCEKVFKPTYLPRHIKRNHRGEVLDPQMLGRDIPDDSLVCRYCLKSCSNPHNRRVHESIHYPVKMQCNQCKICGQKFFNKTSYEIHVLACKSVRCSKCNKIFFRYLSLKNHSCIVVAPGENKA